MTDTWYEILGVEPTASEAEIKGAWRSLVTVLGPTDHRFAAINEAASVLLDPEKRAAYDADVVDVAAPSEPEAAAGDDQSLILNDRDEEPESTSSADEDAIAAPEPAEIASQPAGESSHSVRTVVDGLAHPVVAAVAAVLAVALVLTAAILYLVQNDGPTVTDRTVMVSLTDTQGKPIKQQVPTRETADITAAMQAAVAGVPKILSSDYRTLARNEAEGKAVLTAAYAATSFTPYFDGFVKTNAPRLKQIVICGPALDVGVVRTAPNLVEVLIMFDRFSSNTAGSAVSQDFADVTMMNQNGAWLISNFRTTPLAK
ncbi:hypothetical protein Back2_12380 [Nocardioides baekrokdamisoli]|uniref:J domain-containing protein n=1 Tax=Nocardioides baekrokdamisoli TaxID=1804624 RepID=A0A3G9ITJ5_9ACTN|nr:J domain-containing protein [Nocardioides baekrokdamisoli]BBH16951.1 hypothetical protein Back2_12380 [Nocardioides baekrokdamisoli]